MPEKPPKILEPKRDDWELETQLLLRMPPEPAQALRTCLQEGGANLKDRLSVKFEENLRYGEVRFDHFLMHSKLVDLPTVTESLKTIDRKSFYKTADLCQMLLCKFNKFEMDAPTTDDESPTKNKKKDAHKVDKKYLWPHGITPPCKNVRKRRFRKTLKKKNVDAPEIEKEVKRLLRADNEAVSVKWDIVAEEEDPKSGLLMGNDESTSQSAAAADSVHVSDSNNKKSKSAADKAANDGSSGIVPRDIDIFGEDLSSSDDEDNNINVDVDETSRLTADESRMSNFSSSMQDMSMATEFNKRMFDSPTRSRQMSESQQMPSTSRAEFSDNDGDDSEFMPQLTPDQINERISDLRRQLSDLQNQRIQKEQEISSIENETLRQRMQDALDNILSQILDKEMEMHEYTTMLS